MSVAGQGLGSCCHGNETVLICSEEMGHLQNTKVFTPLALRHSLSTAADNGIARHLFAFCLYLMTSFRDNRDRVHIMENRRAINEKRLFACLSISTKVIPQVYLQCMDSIYIYNIQVDHV